MHLALQLQLTASAADITLRLSGADGEARALAGDSVRDCPPLPADGDCDCDCDCGSTPLEDPRARMGGRVVGEMMSRSAIVATVCGSRRTPAVFRGTPPHQPHNVVKIFVADGHASALHVACAREKFSGARAAKYLFQQHLMLQIIVFMLAKTQYLYASLSRPSECECNRHQHHVRSSDPTPCGCNRHLQGSGGSRGPGRARFKSIAARRRHVGAATNRRTVPTEEECPSVSCCTQLLHARCDCSAARCCDQDTHAKAQSCPSIHPV